MHRRWRTLEDKDVSGFWLSGTGPRPAIGGYLLGLRNRNSRRKAHGDFEHIAFTATSTSSEFL
jgi:hypothetical protein